MDNNIAINEDEYNVTLVDIDANVAAKNDWVKAVDDPSIVAEGRDFWRWRMGEGKLRAST